MPDFWLLIVREYWRLRLRRAQDFASRLEEIVVNERQRAAADVRHAEIQHGRAQVEIIRSRADANLRRAKA